jgi:NADH:ubiquinone oxidoreductase subunit F (NADH-binding)
MASNRLLTPTALASYTDTLPTVTNNTPINQQAGIIQNNGSFGYGSLSQPNCSGLCVFAIGRVNRTGTSEPNTEAVIGAIWQISSPENTQAQTLRLQAEIQQNALENQTTLTEKLATALEQNQMERANAIAIILAKRLGYSDYRQLLRDIREAPKS